MKKIFALGLMFVMFAPFSVFAGAACSWDPGTNSWVNYGDSGSCASDGTPQDSVGYVPPAPSGNSPSGLSGGAEDVSALVSFLEALLSAATKLILGAAVVFFLWGVFQFVKSAGDEEARKTGKDHIIYGVIGIAVIVSMWGLVAFVTGSIGLDTTTVHSVPKLLPMPN